MSTNSRIDNNPKFNAIVTDAMIERVIRGAFPMAGDVSYLTKKESPAAILENNEFIKLLSERCDEIGEFRALKELEELGSYGFYKEMSERYKNFI